MVFNTTARCITDAAHRAMSSSQESRPLVLDPFAGGGAIPIEALRIGADAYATDINPVAIILNRVVLEYIPRYGARLREEVEKHGQRILDEARARLEQYYPSEQDGAIPLAYLWARTIQCEGAACGAVVPLMRSKWLSSRASNRAALNLVSNDDASGVLFEVVYGSNVDAEKANRGTVVRGSATCPICGYTTQVEKVRKQLIAKRGGADTAQLMAVVLTRPGALGKYFREATPRDLLIVGKARDELRDILLAHPDAIPTDRVAMNSRGNITVPLWGMATWRDVYSARQALSLSTFAQLVRDTPLHSSADPGLARSAQTVLALAVDRLADRASSLVPWQHMGSKISATFVRQALSMVWDFGEGNVLLDASGGFASALSWVVEVIKSNERTFAYPGIVSQVSATEHSLPDECVDAAITDPPYYDAVAYAHLSDYFYVWLKRSIGQTFPREFAALEMPKAQEVVADCKHATSKSSKDAAFFESALGKAFSEMKRVLRPNGIAVVMFASKSTASWEAVLHALVGSGFSVTASWPIDTEMRNRVRAIDTASLASSIHIICRPREPGTVGEWRSVQVDLPERVHEWMPRLVSEGITGADAIFSCLGPAIEVFSRYDRVETAAGAVITLREYLEKYGRRCLGKLSI